MTAGERLRLGVVVQRYGATIGAGSEELARQVSERLARRHEVEVLTSCALDYRTWANHFPPGTTLENGVRVRRFAVTEPRHEARFAERSLTLFGRTNTMADERAWLLEQGPNTPELLETLAREAEQFDAFIFFTYLYAPTALGLPLVRDRAVLVPTAHDEEPIHLGVYRDLFTAPRHIVFLSPAERELVHGLFGNEHIPWTVAGAGIEARPRAASVYDFRRRHGIWHDIVLYVGRVDENKGVDILLSHLERYRRATIRPLDLVLVGRQAMRLPRLRGLHALGYVDEVEKAAALSSATIFVLPSRFESFSIVTMEAWSHGLPALVDAHDRVMVDHCHRSQAGLYYRDYDEFAACLHTLRLRPDLRRRMGQNGRRYVEANYRWERVEALFEAAVRSVARSKTGLTRA